MSPLTWGHLCQGLVSPFRCPPCFTQHGMTTVHGPQRPIRESALSPPIRPGRSTPSAGLRSCFPISPSRRAAKRRQRGAAALSSQILSEARPLGHRPNTTATPQSWQPSLPHTGLLTALIPLETSPDPKPKSVRRHQGFPHSEPRHHCRGGCHFVSTLCPGGCRSLMWGKAALGLATRVGWLFSAEESLSVKNYSAFCFIGILYVRENVTRRGHSLPSL